MPSGGKRSGAGRPRGSKTKKQALLLAAAEAGELPVDFLLRIMRDPTVDAAVRMDAAKSVAPYLHPRLAATVISAAIEETQVVIFKTTYDDHAAGVPPVRYDAAPSYDEAARAADTIELAALKALPGPPL
jgi:hypothetical protein